MLNTLWLGFFITAAISALAQWLLGGQAQVFATMVESLFAMAKLSVEVMVLLFGTLTMWLGFLRIAEKAGIVDALARWLSPLFARLMPEVPRGHPALGLMTLNFAANALGLDNAATPMGLKAMRGPVASSLLIAASAASTGVATRADPAQPAKSIRHRAATLPRRTAHAGPSDAVS